MHNLTKFNFQKIRKNSFETIPTFGKQFCKTAQSYTFSRILFEYEIIIMTTKTLSDDFLIEKHRLGTVFIHVFLVRIYKRGIAYLAASNEPCTPECM